MADLVVVGARTDGQVVVMTAVMEGRTELLGGFPLQKSGLDQPFQVEEQYLSRL